MVSKSRFEEVKALIRNGVIVDITDFTERERQKLVMELRREGLVLGMHTRYDKDTGNVVITMFKKGEEKRANSNCENA